MDNNLIDQFYEHIISLYEAIRTNNLSQAIDDVNFFNTNCQKENNLNLYNALKENNPIPILFGTFQNETIEYVINNLHQEYEFIFQWNLKIYKMESEDNESAFITLVQDYLNKTKEISNYMTVISRGKIKADLVRLCYRYHNFILLEEILKEE